MMQVVPSALDGVLSSLRKVKPAGPQKWVACCPAHDDRERSLSVRASEGRILFRCFAGCTFEAVCGALGMQQSDMFADTEESIGVRKREREDVPSATLAELAAARKLPLSFLHQLGWRDGQGVIRIEYKRRNGGGLPTRVRRGHSGSKGVWWEPRGNPGAYEPDGGALAREERYLIVCEGETDTATLLYAGFPALGIPGASLVSSVLCAHHLEGIERVFYVREPDRGGEEFERLVPARLKELGFEGGVYAVKMPDAAKDPSALFVRDPEAFSTKLRAVLDKARQLGESGGVEWRSALDIFAPLPPVSWRVRGLQICPGRPSAFVGYGASAKTLSAQALALACAAGVPAWGFFETAPMQVRHLDFEQGWHATARRYQRLAHGMQLDQRALADRLKVCIFPRVFLDQPGAYDAYAKLCAGADLVVLDSFKAATPSSDENDNGIRTCVDVLTHVSETTGTAFLILHHAGKSDPNARDQRAMGRGASSIFDGCGSWFNFFAGADKQDPRTIRQAKQPAEAEGMGVEDFMLDVLDVHAPGQPNAGVRVVHREVIAPDPVAESSARYDARLRTMLELVERNPGASQNVIIGKSGINEHAAKKLLDQLEADLAIEAVPGPRNARNLFKRGHNRPGGRHE